MIPENSLNTIFEHNHGGGTMVASGGVVEVRCMVKRFGDVCNTGRSDLYAIL